MNESHNRAIGNSNPRILLLMHALMWALITFSPRMALPAQSAPGPQTQPATQTDGNEPMQDAGENPAEGLSSLETGSTELDQSFGPVSRRERIRELRRKGFDGTTFNWQLRTQYIDRDLFDGTQNEAWALAASAGFKTGYFGNLVALGATGYTSQPLYAPQDKDGTLLLAPDQKGYTVLGEAYAQFLVNDGLSINLGRKIYDTPFINRDDIRMTPQTFEAATLQGAVGGGDQAEWRYGAGYFDKEKGINSEDFVSMARVAGASVSRGVYVAGANYKEGEFSLGAIDYYSQDIINIAYTEARYALRVGDDLTLRLFAQYTSQRSVGGNLLTGTSFSGDQFGLKAELPVGATLLTTAFTTTGNGANLQSPWSGYPGYTRVMIQNFNRAGENALLLRAQYNILQVPGLSTYALWVHGSEPRDRTLYARDEYDLDAQWSPPSGKLSGLMFRFRYAYITQTNDTRFTDFRLMIYYTPPSN